MQRQWAILLLGPTGAGKTPLGDEIEAVGIPTRRCVHFDFGACLRAAADAGADEVLDEAMITTVRRRLAKRALLEEDEFPIAATVLKRFLKERDVVPADLLILNGLPRHRGQAEALAPLVDVRHLVVLDCDAPTVHARIRGNTGGDRATRDDDALGDIETKLAVYRERTEPLIMHYAREGTPVHRLTVTSSQTAEQAWEALLPRLQQPDLCGRCGR